MRIRTLATIVGLAIGVAGLTAGFNFSETAYREIMRQVSGIDTRLIYVQAAPDDDGLLPLAERDVWELATLPGVAGATGIRPSFHLATTPDTVVSAPVFGINAGVDTVLRLQVARGRHLSAYDDHNGTAVCLLGPEMAKRLFPRSDPVGSQLQVDGVPLRIVGLVAGADASRFVNDQRGIFVPTSRQSTLRHQKPGLPTVILRAEPGRDVAQLRAEVMALLEQRYPNARLQSWDQAEVVERQQRVVNTIQWLIGSISGMTLLVACISCANVMVVTVNERTREIGLRLALGATRYDILGRFLLEGMVLMIGGGALGLVGGYFLTLHLLEPLPELIPGYRTWDFNFSSRSVVQSLVVLTISAFAASLLPAMRAAALDPVRALREG